MPVPIRKSIVLGVIILMSAVGYALSARPQPPSPTDDIVRHPVTNVSSRTARDRKQVLRSACSATACHGAPSTRALVDEPGASAWTTSATQWNARDPHVRATEVLAGTHARRIMQQLHEDEPERWAAEALEEVRCLACHTNASLVAGKQRPDRDVMRSEGVSCEACHGNASEWLLDHTSWSSAQRVERYRALGMTKLYDVGERALVCTGCHVGAPADPASGIPLRDMNHDMIAAGHPRLTFEFADHQRRLPPHWVEKDRTRDPCVLREPEFEAKAWLVGRVASAEAACRLLADRAERAEREDGNGWPELSEMKCFACHRELLPKSSQPAVGRHRTPWQSIWPLTRREHFAPVAVPRGDKLKQVAAELMTLQRCFERREPKSTDALKSAARAATALQELRLELADLTDREAAKLVLEIYSRVRTEELDWEESCQVTQGLFSLEWMRLRRMSLDRRVPNPLFEDVTSELSLPRPFGKEHFDSPRRLNPNSTNGTLHRLLLSVRETCTKGLE